MENYEQISIIGRGSFGEVFKMRDKRTNDIVAMKVISKVCEQSQQPNHPSQISLYNKIN